MTFEEKQENQERIDNELEKVTGTDTTLIDWLVNHGITLDMIKNQNFLTVTEVGKILSLHPVNIRKMIEDKKIKGFKLGQYRIPTKEFIIWFVNQCFPERRTHFEKALTDAMTELKTSQKYKDASANEKINMEIAVEMNIDNKYFPELF